MANFTTKEQLADEQREMFDNIIVYARYTDDTNKEFLQAGTIEDFKDFARFAYAYNDCTGIDVIEFKYQDLRCPNQWHDVKIDNEWYGYTNWIECSIEDFVISQASEQDH